MSDRLSALCLALLLAAPLCLSLDDEVFAPRLRTAADTVSLASEGGRAASFSVPPAGDCDTAAPTLVSDARPLRPHHQPCGLP